MTISAVIIDDEPNNIKNLEVLLKQHCMEVGIIGCAQHAAEGEALIRQLQPDLVFLDIQMPDKNGFDILRDIPDRDFELVFITAFDLYAIQAIRFSALDYLLKPVKANELKDAVQKAINRRKEKKQNHKVENLLEMLEGDQHKKQQHRLALTSAKETRFVRTTEIIRCESSNNYTTFFLKEGEKILVSKPIYEYEELLVNYGFLRCHQSHLVNRHYIKSLVKQDFGYLLLEDNSQIPVSRQKKDFVKKQLEKL
jgi:two-component system LytT family response regulator